MVLLWLYSLYLYIIKKCFVYFQQDGYCGDAASDTGCYGGFSRLTTALTTARAAATCSLFLDAGDNNFGTLWTSTYKGKEYSEFVKFFRQDAITLGNHEWNFGPKVTGEFMNNISAKANADLGRDVPIVISTIDVTNAVGMSTAAKALIKKYAIVTDSCSRKIGIVGHLTAETKVISSPDGVVFSSKPATAINAAVTSLLAEDSTVKIILLLSHNGVYDSEALLPYLSKDIDAVIDGHSHTFLYGTTPRTGGVSPSTEGPSMDSAGTKDKSWSSYPHFVTRDSSITGGTTTIPLATAMAYSKYLGKMTLSFEDNGLVTAATGNPVLLGSTNSSNVVAKDSATETLVATLKTAVTAIRGEAVGTVPTEMSGDRNFVRYYDMPISNLVTDAMVYYTNTIYPSLNTEHKKVEIALTNGGGIRSGLKNGTVSYGDILSITPFSNTLEVLNVTGANLKKDLLHGLEGWGTGKGWFPCVAGINMKWSNSTGNNTIWYLKVLENGVYVDLVATDVYSVATNNYLAKGGDDYLGLKASVPINAGPGPNLEDGVIAYIKSGLGGKTYASPEKRIDGPVNAPSASSASSIASSFKTACVAISAAVAFMLY